MAKTPTRKMKNRSIAIMGMLFAAVCVIIGFLVYYQIINYDVYQSKAIAQQTMNTTINANRGKITDCNGVELAVSSSVKTVFISPKNIKDEQAHDVAKNLSEILGVDYDTVYAKTQKNNYYEVIKRKIESDVADRVRQYISDSKVTGIHLIDDTKRYYPYNNLASHVLGFIGTDNVGLDGIELMYNSYLQGTNGKLITAKNNAGSELPVEYETYVPAKNGNDIKLTIDTTIQYYLEKHIEQAREDYKCLNGAAAVIMDVNTGGILGITSKPDYDLNNYQQITDKLLQQELELYESSGAPAASTDKKETDSQDKEDGAGEKKKTVEEKKSELINLMRRNKLIVDTYEPGSTFKILTASIAVEENLISDSDSFYCPGYFVVGNRRISCWKHGGHGSQNFAESINNSCNPAFMMIGAKIGNTTFKNYYKNFGLTEKTGVDLAGEATGIFHADANFNEVELATASFGQRFKVTPIQMITAVAAVANGGTLLTPHVVKEITSTDENGKTTVVKSIENGAKRQVISKETSERMCALLKDAATVGSGKNAYVKGYRVAGKTGTSEKLSTESTTGEEEYIASFIGFAPADDPQIAILVMLDELSGSEYFGGLTAAPTAGKILSDVLPYLEITPQYTQEELSSLDTTVPAVSGLTTDEAVNAVKESGLSYKIIGGEGTVDYQLPKSGTPIPRTGTVVLYTNGKEPSATITVPDITNMSVAGAQKMISNYGLNLRVIGNENTKSTALITSQEPAAGTVVEAGSVITAYYKNYNDVSN